jgi:hypothetical protein
MADFIITTDCDCGCGSPCAGACCTISEGDLTTTIFDSDNPGEKTNTYDVTGQFPADADVEFYFDTGFSDCYAEFVVKANGVTIYDSGCVADASGSTHIITVPGGTTSLSVTVTWGCSGTWIECGWLYTIDCA